MKTIAEKIKESSNYWFGSFPSFEDACGPDFPKVILPIIRRVMPSIIAQDIIGVSPMTGPVADIFSLRACYADSQKDDKDEETDS